MGEDTVMVVLTTVETKEDGERLARAMVEERLAACAQVSGPMVSHYWWEGKVERAEEWLVRLKTTAGRYPALEERLVELHLYSLPQVVAVPAEAAFGPYREWVAGEVHA